MGRAVTEILFVVEEAAEGGFSARAMGCSIFTQAGSMDALKVEVRDAVRCHVEEGEAPLIMRLHLVRHDVMVA
jgi:hypothetical protein